MCERPHTQAEYEERGTNGLWLQCGGNWRRRWPRERALNCLPDREQWVRLRRTSKVENLGRGFDQVFLVFSNPFFLSLPLSQSHIHTLFSGGQPPISVSKNINKNYQKVFFVQGQYYFPAGYNREVGAAGSAQVS